MIRFPWGRSLPPGSAKPQSDEPAVVHGERANFIASGARSLQSRMTTMLAAGLMTSVGAGMLAWYYAEALSRPASVNASVRAPLPEAAGEGMTLPTFEAVAPPRAPRLTPPGESVLSTATIAALPSSGTGQASSVTAPPLNPGLEPLDRAPGGPAGVYSAQPPPSPRQRALDRRLSGEVFTGGGTGTSSNLMSTGIGEGPAAAVPVGGMQAQERIPPGGARADAMQSLLRPGVMTATRAQILPTQRLLLSKGTFIDCTLETAIDSSLPGMTTCITATDTFGADGTVVLLERGTRLIGETRGEVQQGGARVFVVWTEARTPSGVAVRLDSPGTDALGRSGLDGKVNRHFWQRFGAAVLVSTIDDVVQSEVQSSSRSGTVVLDPTASEDVVNDILRSTVNIPPTIRVRNGARIQVLVARDVDFRPVYELEPR
ncbi:MAG: type IV secretion system protein VirB10 [Steroidobacteraceae bacterium]